MHITRSSRSARACFEKRRRIHYYNILLFYSSTGTPTNASIRPPKYYNIVSIASLCVCTRKLRGGAARCTATTGARTFTRTYTDDNIIIIYYIIIAVLQRIIILHNTIYILISNIYRTIFLRSFSQYGCNILVLNILYK